VVEATPGAKRRPVGVRPRRRQKFCQTFSGFWITRPLFFPEADENKIQAAQKYNFQRYHYQGIGCYEPSDVYKRGLADLQILASVIGDNRFLFDSEPTSIDAGVYGFVANLFLQG